MPPKKMEGNKTLMTGHVETCVMMAVLTLLFTKKEFKDQDNDQQAEKVTSFSLYRSPNQKSSGCRLTKYNTKSKHPFIRDSPISYDAND